MIKAIAENGDKKLLGDVQKRVRDKIGQVMLRLQWGCATMRTTSTWSNNEPNWHTVINRTEIQLNSVRSSWPLTTTKIHQIGDRCQRWAVRTPKTPCTGLKSAELLLCRTGKATPRALPGGASLLNAPGTQIGKESRVCWSLEVRLAFAGAA